MLLKSLHHSVYAEHTLNRQLLRRVLGETEVFQETLTYREEVKLVMFFAVQIVVKISWEGAGCILNGIPRFYVGIVFVLWMQTISDLVNSIAGS